MAPRKLKLLDISKNIANLQGIYLRNASMSLMLLEQFNNKKIAEYKNPECDFSSFNVGDTVIVGTNIVEGATTRVQQFQGVCIAKVSRSIASSFIVRKLTTSGDAIEKNFKIYLSAIQYVKILKRGKVRRAKLYYLRNRSAKMSRIKENFIAH